MFTYLILVINWVISSAVSARKRSEFLVSRDNLQTKWRIYRPVNSKSGFPSHQWLYTWRTASHISCYQANIPDLLQQFVYQPATPSSHMLLTCSNTRCGSRGGPGGPGPPLDPRFWGPKIEHFWALFNFSLIFFASLCSAYYFFNMMLFQSSNSKIFQPCFARHMISHLEVFVFSLSFTHFRLLAVHLSLSFF